MLNQGKVEVKLKTLLLILWCKWMSFMKWWLKPWKDRWIWSFQNLQLMSSFLDLQMSKICCLILHLNTAKKKSYFQTPCIHYFLLHSCSAKQKNAQIWKKRKNQQTFNAKLLKVWCNCLNKYLYRLSLTRICSFLKSDQWDNLLKQFMILNILLVMVNLVCLPRPHV